MTTANGKATTPDLCKVHGFQTEPGFEVDRIEGELTVSVIVCHSTANPEPKERIVIVVPRADGSMVARVHDFAAIRRAHGHQVVGDVWSFGQSVAKRIMTWVGRQLQRIDKLAAEKILRLLKM